MVREINLLPPKDVAQEKLENLSKKLIVFSALLVITTAVSIVGLFSYWGLLIAKNSSLKNEIEDFTAQIQSTAEREVLYRVVKANLANVAKIIDSRVNFSEVLDHLQEISVDGVFFTDLSMDSEGKLTISGVGISSTALAAALNNLVHPDKGGKYFDDVNVTGLIGDKTGVYRFTIVMKIKGVEVITLESEGITQ